MNNYSLRLLDPLEDFDLFHLAYKWRARPKSHIQPDRMPFEEFAAARDDQITIGLFNGELRAVYFLHETEPGNYQAHFTSERGLSREALLAGAAQVASDFFDAGAKQIHAWVTERNGPLRSFLETLGFIATGTQTFPCQNDTDRSTMPSVRYQRFVKYVLMVNDHRSLRSKTD